MHFKVVVEEYSPYVSVTKRGDRVTISGPVAEMFHWLASFLNFTYSLHISEDQTWGSQESNGSWTGMIGMLWRNEVDIGIGPYTLTHERFTAVQTSVPFFVDQAILLSHSEDWEMSIFSFFRIFSWEIWFCLFFSTVVVAWAASISDFIFQRKRIRSRFFHNLWELSRTFLNQEQQKRPQRTSLSLLWISWTFSILLLSIMFSGKFLSTLLVRKVRNIDSLDDLASASGVCPILERGSSVFMSFQRSDSHVVRTLYERVMENEEKSLMTLAEMTQLALDRVDSGSYALIKDGVVVKRMLAKRYSDQLPCPYHMTEMKTFTLWKVMAFKRHFPKSILNRMNKVIRSVAESRLLNAKMRYQLMNFTKCLDYEDEDVHPLSVDDLEGVFILWMIGCALAGLALAVEWIIGRRSLQHQQIFHSPMTNEPHGFSVER